MSLDDFFRINLPYGIKRNPDNTWFAFNREYLPIGWNAKDKADSIYKPFAFSDVHINTEYKGLTERNILAIVDDKAIRRNEDGEIVLVYFYDDSTNPNDEPEYWERYLSIIKRVSKFSKAR